MAELQIEHPRTITMADLKAAQSERLQPVVVTNENFDAYVDDKLGVNTGEDGVDGAQAQDTIKGAAANPDPVKEAEKAAAALVAPKEGEEQGGKVFFNGKWVGKGDFGYRLHVKTKEATAEFEKKVADATKAAQDAQTERDKAQARANELAARYEPPKPDVPGPEPRPEQFVDAQQWAKAYAEHARDVATYEARQAVRQAEQAKAWGERQAAARKDIPDFDAAIDAAADLRVSQELTEAVRDSDFGPHLLHHFATHRDVLNHLHALPIGKMLRELGKLEATFSKVGQAAQTPPAATPAAKVAPAVEVSRAPAPIEPIKGGTTSAMTLSGSDDVPANMTYEDWKAARKAGRIR